MQAVHTEVAKILVDIGAVNFTPHAPVTFKSGIVSPVYVDNRIIPYHPDAWKTVIAGFQAITDAQSIPFDIIAGIAAAGIPHSAALGYRLGKPSLFIRKEAKEHGQKKRIEGGDVAEKRVLLVEDLITTGGSSISGVMALREAGAQVNDCMAIVSYGFNEANTAFKQAGVNLHTLTTFPTILEYAREQGKISETVLKSVHSWMQAPHAWGEHNG